MRIKIDCPINFMDDKITAGLNMSDDPECLIVNPGTDKFLTNSYFDKYKNLKVVGTPSTGVNHIDVNYLDSRNIKLYSLLDDRESLDKITASAEFTWLHIMNAVRKFTLSLDFASRWRDSGNEQFLRSNELSGKKLGIIGFGRIGRKLNKYAKAFEMDVKFYDPYVRGSCKSIEDLYDSDILSVNCYLNDETRGMISNGFFDGFKDGLIVVNTSRGEVADENYVAEMVDNHKIFYSCDVLSNEQDMSKLHSSPLWGMYKYYSNLIVTPHVAGATVESQEKALRSILNLCTK